MLENLTDKIGHALRNLRGVSKLSEDNMQAALKEVRQALLSADVHFKVARKFVSEVQAKCAAKPCSSRSHPGSKSSKLLTMN